MAGFRSRWKHLGLLLLYPLLVYGFVYCEAVVTQATYIMEWPQVDRAIPFVPFMVWPYLFWYPAIFFTFVWLGWRDPPAFTRYTWFVYAATASTYVIYLLFPNGEQLRPALSSLGAGWDFDALRWVYLRDTPNNVNPSIHVIDTLAFWFALAKDPTLRPRRWFQILLAGVGLTIIASTVMVKQHSILDIFGGLATSAVWYGLIYSRWSPFTRS